MGTIHLLGTAMGLGFVSGINLYATVLAVGWAINLGLIRPAPDLVGLAVLGHPLVLTVAAFCYAGEFFADKIPWLDTMWDILHTFIRPLGAALVASAALGQADPALGLAAVLLAGAAALSTHATKAGVRLAANASPEPFSNIALSLFEDVVAVTGAWLALTHPVATGALALAFLAAFALLLPRVLRLARVQVIGLRGVGRSWLGRGPAPGQLVDELPAAYAAALPPDFGEPRDAAVRCVAGRGVGARVNQPGVLCVSGAEVFFLGRQGGRARRYPVPLGDVVEVGAQPGCLFDRLILRYRLGAMHVHLPRDARSRLSVLAARLDAARREAALSRAA